MLSPLCPFCCSLGYGVSFRHRLFYEEHQAGLGLLVLRISMWLAVRSGVHSSGCLLLAEAKRRYVVGLSCYPRRLTFPQPFSYALRALVVSLLGFKLRHNRRRVSVVLVFSLERCSVSQCRRSCPWLV
ncbi:hypothetical protein DY000_02022844 [Brassica cretica]|uniref:Secreted protein n=1 Tax=Brassica cretica TaxID=69181 RepID=A0ABQ7EE22_BRACR|nr:hypothetical protein DY000_02022844 [Brassica cretica]